MLDLPIRTSNIHPPLSSRWNFPTRHGRHVGLLVRVIDAAGTMPCDVLISVIRFTWWRQPVVRIGKFTLDITSLASGLYVVIVDYPTSADNYPRTELAKDRPCRHHANRTTLVRMRDDVSLDDVVLFRVIDDDLMQVDVFREE